MTPPNDEIQIRVTVKCQDAEDPEQVKWRWGLIMLYVTSVAIVVGSCVGALAAIFNS